MLIWESSTMTSDYDHDRFYLIRGFLASFMRSLSLSQVIVLWYRVVNVNWICSSTLHIR